MRPSREQQREALRRLRIAARHHRNANADPLDQALAIDAWIRWAGLDHAGWKVRLYDNRPALTVNHKLVLLDSDHPAL
ncbi:hypothetical protein [Thiohalocapsa marina]|uniref:hypothetical protein n=1 Tax=Thiohalocapsa marina TaxID=424902 RepID=UPI0036DB4F43